METTWKVYVSAKDQLTGKLLTLPLTFRAEGLTKSDARKLALESAREGGAHNPRVTAIVRGI